MINSVVEVKKEVDREVSSSQQLYTWSVFGLLLSFMYSVFLNYSLFTFLPKLACVCIKYTFLTGQENIFRQVFHGIIFKKCIFQ